MNVFLATLRRIALGGTVLLILSLALKGALPSGYWEIILLVSPLLYLVFMFFTWLKIKRSTKAISEQVGTSIPTKGYFGSLLRALFIDITSPIGVIIDLFRKSSAKVPMFIVTYLIIAACAAAWFFFL